MSFLSKKPRKKNTNIVEKTVYSKSLVIVIIILVVCFLGFIIFHYTTFNHHKVKVVTKIKDNEEIVEGVEKIIKGIKENRPKAEIYLESIYPVNHDIRRNNAGNRKNSDIKEINEKLEDYCEDNDITYIDMYDLLKDDDDNLKEEYTKDGLHLSDKGYEVVTKEIKQIIS